jgi:putative transposase
MTSLEERQQVVEPVREATVAGARQEQACAVLGMSARTLQRWQEGETVRGDQRPLRQYEPPHQLSAAERAEVLAVANSAEFGPWPPCQSVPRLADQGRYLALESTFYRVLRAEGPLAHRRSERPARARSKPKAVCATAPNQVLQRGYHLPADGGPRAVLLSLPVPRPLQSQDRRLAGLRNRKQPPGQRDIAQYLPSRGGARHQLLLHSDKGGPMKGATMLATLQGLGVMPSFSRPAVSHDNPYSESLFKTLKYRPDYPLKPFADVAAARHWVTGLVAWYNHEHRHRAIRFVTPAQRHAGLDGPLLEHRKAVYEAARLDHPRRWHGATRNWQRIQAVHLNPDHSETGGDHFREVENQAQKAA